MSEAPEAIRLVPIPGLPEVEPGTDLASMIREAAEAAGVELDRNVVVIAQKIVSKAEGRLVRLSDVTPGEEAREIAADHDRDPRQPEPLPVQGRSQPSSRTLTPARAQRVRQPP